MCHISRFALLGGGVRIRGGIKRRLEAILSLWWQYDAQVFGTNKLTCVCSLVRISLLACTTAEGFPETMMVRLRSFAWLISMSHPVCSMMSRTISDWRLSLPNEGSSNWKRRSSTGTWNTYMCVCECVQLTHSIEGIQSLHYLYPSSSRVQIFVSQ